MTVYVRTVYGSGLKSVGKIKRDMGMKVIYSPVDKDLVRNHPWDVSKYQKIRDKLLREGVIDPEDVIESEEADELDLLRVHTLEYIEKLDNPDSFSDEEIRMSELPVSSGLISFFKKMCEGTILAARYALTDGIAVNMGGGKHHCHRGYASGFCLVQDLAVAVKTLQAEELISTALVVDLDLHQGDSTAKIFADDNSVFTFSIHQLNIFPYVKQKSDLDIGLDAGIGDAEYLSILENALKKIFSDNPQPDLILYQAGVDPFIGDPLGELCLSEEGLMARDRMVLDWARKKGVPAVVTFGGGYSDKVVDLHANTVISAASVFKKN